MTKDSIRRDSHEFETNLKGQYHQSYKINNLIIYFDDETYPRRVDSQQ